MQRRTILVIPADTHAGSEVGLMPPGQWAKEGGGFHNPTDAQRGLNKIWVEAWEKVSAIRKTARLIVVHAGDAVEGIHHHSVQTWTTRIVEMEACHIASMEQGLNIAGYDPGEGDLCYYVKGTPAHVGPGGGSEERIARDIDGCVPKIKPQGEEQKDGRYLWDRLRLDINGKLFDISHHGANLSRLPWSKTNPLRSKLMQIYWRALESGQRAPDYWIRAHMHQAAHDIMIAGNGQLIHGYVCPALQGKTEFGYKVAGDMLASLGVLIFEIGADGNVIDHSIIYQLQEDEVRVL